MRRSRLRLVGVVLMASCVSSVALALPPPKVLATAPSPAECARLPVSQQTSAGTPPVIASPMRDCASRTQPLTAADCAPLLATASYVDQVACNPRADCQSHMPPLPGAMSLCAGLQTTGFCDHTVTFSPRNACLGRLPQKAPAPGATLQHFVDCSGLAESHTSTKTELCNQACLDDPGNLMKASAAGQSLLAYCSTRPRTGICQVTTTTYPRSDCMAKNPPPP
jgi:hypothetical protein